MLSLRLTRRHLPSFQLFVLFKKFLISHHVHMFDLRYSQPEMSQQIGGPLHGSTSGFGSRINLGLARWKKWNQGPGHRGGPPGISCANILIIHVMGSWLVWFGTRGRRKSCQ
ncbi:hypothetical protein QUC31_008637 [Theobroma cacao]|uniref:Uncharacterized protein n=1 Tax=Theobroma cacao TaxID=3641 RepID=A0A061G4X7_THECC|nr:Uncharacterized protein TCM_015880 [Theobroma cacao]WRX18212.1 hypothetical protein QQP08_010699 [Theobroma cacao]